MKADEMKIFRLEDRILFEAAAAAEIVEAVQNDSTSPEAEDKNQSEVNTAANAPVENSANYNKPAGETEYLSDVEVEINALIEGVKPQTTIDNDLEFVQKYDNESVISSDRELVVISSSVKDMSSILEQLSPTQEVLVLEQNNGLDELNTYLQEHENVYSAIHFISHGNAGEIVINGEIISNDNFEAAEWAEIGKSLTADGDILFYGCDIAQNEAGETLINRIAEVTNADVAASSDRTGFAGNWELEYINGNVTTQYLSVSAYTHTLADGQDIHYVSDYSELRDVLEDIADNGGDHTIKITQDIDFADQDVISVSFNKAATVVIEADTVKTITGSDAQGVFEFWNTDQKVVSITINQLIFQDAIPDIDDVDGVESAIYSSDIDLTLNNSTFQNFDGSAICAESWSRLHSLSVTYCNFLNNKSLEVGGAISAYAKNVTISNSYFYKNSAVDFGGAIELDASGKTIITNTSFWENYTDDAGGAINATTEGDSFTISNCTFYKNSAADSGGAIQFYALGTGEISISDTTFADNKLTDSNGQGSAIYNNGAILKIHNTLLIGEGKSVLYQNAEGESQLTYSLVTSCDKAKGAKIEFGTGAFENTKYSVSEIFTTAEDEHHTIGINAFSEAAWGGATPVTDDAVDQRGVLRNSINTALSISGKYSIGAVTAQAAVQVVQENYSTGYTGNVITPENHTHLMYADGKTEISKSITSVKLTSEPTPIIDVGTYDIAPSEAVIAGLASTVLVAYESGKLTVTPANLTITVKAEKVYDGSAAVGNSVFSFDITGDGASEFKTDWISVDSFTYHSKNVEGIQDAIGTISLAVAAKNFNIDSVEFLGEINAKNITVVAHDATKIYGDSDPELVYTATGLVGADTLAGSLVREAGENVGTYEITQGTLANANYIIDFTKGSFTITPKTITVVAHDATKIYGDSDPELVYTATGLVGADTLAGSLVREAGENVGTYEITQGTLANANYIIDFTKGSFSITPRDIMVSIDGSLFNKVFDGTVATEVADQNYSTNKLVDDEVFVSGYYFYDNAEAGTNKIVTLSDITLSGADAANYKLVNSVVSDNGAVITPKTVEVVFVTEAPYIYDGTDQSDTVSATYTDVNGNKVQLQINWNGQEFIKPGTYTVVAEFITADPNYQLKDAFAQVVMGGEIKTSAPIYSDGTNPDYSSVIPAIQGKILASDEGKLYYNNIYTMDYSELLATVAKQREVVMESFYSIDGSDFKNFSCLVSVDTLKYKPFELEVPVKEIADSVIGNSNVIAPEDFIRNQELNIEGKSKDNYRLLDEQGETLGGHYEDFYMDDYAEEFFELPEMAVTTFDKVENMKSELELLIDKLAKCV